MSGELILVVHPEAEILDTLSRSLHAAGYKVMGAATSESALESIEGTRFFQPDALLTPIDTDHTSGSPLVERFRADAHGAQVPIVVLANGNSDARRHALRLGLNHVIQPPYDDEEVVLSTRLALEHHRDERLLSGSLAQMSPVELLQSAETNRRSGTIMLRHRGRVGTVWMRDGQVIDAEVDDGRRREEAVYAMACWDEGTFEANFGPVSIPQRIQRSTTGLLLEAMRRRDEADRETAAANPPSAALDDPPPQPSRPMLALHRGLTLLNLATSYAGDHLEQALIRRRLEAIRNRLVRDHGLLAHFRVNAGAQVYLADGAPSPESIDPRRLVEAIATWLRELFHELNHALPGHFPLARLGAISEAIRGDLSSLGFYRDLGLGDEDLESEDLESENMEAEYMETDR